MTKEEILLKIGERIAALSHNASQMCEEYEGYRLACMDVSDILDEITKELDAPSLPPDIDEAAEEYAAKAGLQPEAFIAIPSFKAGAEWMAGQGVTEVSRLYRDPNPPHEGLSFGVLPFFSSIQMALNYQEGEEVIVQIRKK